MGGTQWVGQGVGWEERWDQVDRAVGGVGPSGWGSGWEGGTKWVGQ